MPLPAGFEVVEQPRNTGLPEGFEVVESAPQNEQPQFSAADDVGAGEAALIGAGKGLTDVPRGIGQALSSLGASVNAKRVARIQEFEDKWLSGSLTDDDIGRNLPIQQEAKRLGVDLYNTDSLTTEIIESVIQGASDRAQGRVNEATDRFQGLTQQQIEANESLDPLREAHPVATPVGEIGGFVAPSLLIPGSAATLPGRMGVGALTGAGIGTVAPTTDETIKEADDQRQESAITGAAFGGVAPAAISALKPVVTKLSETIKGVVSGSTPSKAVVDKVLKESAPSIESLKDSARAVYKEIDDLGVSLKPEAFSSLAKNLQSTARKEGFNKRIHPKVSAALDEFRDTVGKSPSLGDIDILRRVAQSAAKSIEPDEARIGSILISKIDDYMDNVSDKALSKPAGVNIGDKYKNARDLWGRSKRSEAISNIFEKAKNQASGFENGLRTQFRALLNNKKRLRGFSKDEISAMQLIVRGGKAENLAKAIGKFGFTEGQASGMLLSSLGVAGGAAIGGPAGGAVVPIIGQVSKSLAQRLTKKNAEFADDIVRAGKSGRAIVEAYLKNTPKDKRSAFEITELLIRSDVVLDDLAAPPKTKAVQDAIYFARQAKAQDLASRASAAASVSDQDNQE